jgi:heavy metal sensor kinase
MSLASRISAFFLGALAIVLIGFSAATLLLARSYLHRQNEARLATALDTLAAAAEIDARGVEWEPGERQLTLGADPAQDQVRWMIRDETGALIDRSRNSSKGATPRDWGLAEPSEPASARAKARTWSQAVRTLVPNPSVGIRSEPHDVRHARLILTVGVSNQPASTALEQLAITLIGLSAAAWLLAAALGRRLCRRALAPLNRMATIAREMTAADLGQRLPDPTTGDELEELAQAFNDLLARLQQAFERQKRFTGDASHQLRTPLTALLGQVEVALRRDRPEEEYRRVLELVERRAISLRQIVESLLFLARTESEAELPALELVDLAAWVTEQVRRWSSHPRAGDLSLEIAEAPLWVRIHSPLLAQAFENLLDNAFKYSQPGTAVTVRLTSRDGRARLVVSDHGFGVASDETGKLLEPFYRSPEARKRGLSGVGLGLSIAQRIATSLGGTIEVLSTPDSGSSFSIVLPTEHVPQPEKTPLLDVAPAPALP